MQLNLNNIIILLEEHCCKHLLIIVTRWLTVYHMKKMMTSKGLNFSVDIL